MTDRPLHVLDYACGEEPAAPWWTWFLVGLAAGLIATGISLLAYFAARPDIWSPSLLMAIYLMVWVGMVLVALAAWSAGRERFADDGR